MLRALPRVALQLWIVLFIVFFGAEVVHLEPGLRILTQLLYGVPLVAWAGWRVRGPADRLEWGVLGALGAYTVVALASRDRTESLGTVGLVTALAAWFMLMRRVEGWALRPTVVIAAATGLALTLAYNAYLLVAEKLEWYRAVGGAPFEGVTTFPWESVNALPILVLLAVPVVALLPSGGFRIVIAAVVGASALVVVPISMGRAGWLGMVVAAGLLLLGWVQPPRRMLASGAVAASALAGAGLLGPRLVGALADSGRLALWEQGWSMVAARPLLGSGPGVYSWARLEFPPSTADLVAVRLLHNVPLQTLADGGLVLLGAGVGVLVVWILTARAGNRGWTSAQRIVAACLTGLGVALFLDDFGYLPAITTLAVTLAALLVPLSARPSGWLAPTVLAAAAVVAMPGVIAVDAARAAAQAGRTALVEGRTDAAVDAFSSATRWHPEGGGYWLGLGMAASYAGDEATSISAYRQAAEASPGDPRGYAARAAIEVASDQITLLTEAAERTLGDPSWSIRLGLALAGDGRLDEAAEAWGRAVALGPELYGELPYERSGISQAGVIDAAESALTSAPRPGGAERDSARWDLALATDTLPDDAGTAWRAVDAARDGDAVRARDLADEAVEAAPYDARAYRALAAVAVFACDSDLEQQALELERATGDAYLPLSPEPHARREFVYREASLGPSQPPGAEIATKIERWPWSLIDRPTGCS